MPTIEVPLSPTDAGEEGVDQPFTDEELTELALAADPAVPLADDAIPFAPNADRHISFLPQWYMPPVMLRTPKRWHRWAIVAVVVAFVTIDLFGLCSTYGPLSAA